MTEVLIQYTTQIPIEGISYVPRACGEIMSGGTWQGWIEFLGTDGSVLRTDRETTQSNREDLEYWATGLSGEYLEGALERALNPPRPREPADILPPQAPAPRTNPRAVPLEQGRAVLDPFSVYTQGEGILRKELAALSRDHLRNIIAEYDLDTGQRLTGASEVELANSIVKAVRESVGDHAD